MLNVSKSTPQSGFPTALYRTGRIYSFKVKLAPEGIRYYPFSRNWKRIRPHLANPEFRAVLERDFNIGTMGQDIRAWTISV
jgi:hypothetical protein